MMENFESDIINFRGVTSSEIDYYYSRLFAISVIKMLKTLGIEDKEIYVMPDKKKRLRQLSEKTLGLCYYSNPLPKNQSTQNLLDGVEIDGRYYQIECFFKISYASLPNDKGLSVNSGFLQIGNMEEWSKFYNYLRIEINTPRAKRQVIKASCEDDINKFM